MEEVNSAGQPSKCTPERLKAARVYINKPLFETYQKEVLTKEGIEVINLERPTWVSVAGLSIELDVARKTIYNWSNPDHPSFNEEFLHIFESLAKRQELLLEYHGLTKGYDAGFAKFIATNITRYKDKKEAEVNGDIKIVIDKSDSEL
jgi:hypothetical protein